MGNSGTENSDRHRARYEDISYSALDSFYIVPIMAGLMEGRTWFFTQAITLSMCILLYENTLLCL